VAEKMKESLRNGGVANGSTESENMARRGVGEASLKTRKMKTAGVRPSKLRKNRGKRRKGVLSHSSGYPGLVIQPARLFVHMAKKKNDNRKGDVKGWWKAGQKEEAREPRRKRDSIPWGGLFCIDEPSPVGVSRATCVSKKKRARKQRGER